MILLRSLSSCFGLPRTFPSALAFLLTAPLAAQSPWAVVPAVPTACYTEGDPFPKQLEAASVANQDALGRQEQINQELHDQLVELDDAVAQRRMIE